MPDLKGTLKKYTESALQEALLLLGINETPLDKSEKILLNEVSFNKLSQKEGAYILHFLFTVIDKTRTAKTFRNCWPILDMKQEACFRRAALEWFKELNQKEKFGKRFVVSLIACVTPGSQKFLQTILSLTCYALYSMIIKKENHNFSLMHPTCSQHHNLNINIKKHLRRLKKYHATKYAEETSDQKELLCLLNQTILKLYEDYQNLSEEEEKLSTEFANEGQTVDDLEHDIAKKNGDIKSMWELVNRFRSAVAAPYSTIGGLILKGSLTSIDGDVLLESSEPINSKLDCLKNDKLDLVSAIKSAIPALTEIEQFSQNSSGSAEKSLELRNHVMSTDTAIDELQAELDILDSRLFSSLKVLHQQINCINILPNDQYKEAMRLCPPTPPYSTKPNPRESLMKTYQLFNLTPERSFLSSKKNIDTSCNPESSSKVDSSLSNKSCFALKTPARHLGSQLKLDINSCFASNTPARHIGSQLKLDVNSCFASNTSARHIGSQLKLDVNSCMSDSKDSLMVSPSLGCNKLQNESLQSLLERMSTLIDSPMPSKESTPGLQWLLNSASRSKMDTSKRNMFNFSNFIDVVDDSPKMVVKRNQYVEQTLFHSITDTPSNILKDTEMFSAIETNASNTIYGEEEESFTNIRSVNFELDRMKEDLKFLPSCSLYSTALESFAAGELNDEVVLNDEFSEQVRRESLQERRHSILAFGNKKPHSPMFSELMRLSTNEDNIFDESDSCLLTSFEL